MKMNFCYLYLRLLINNTSLQVRGDGLSSVDNDDDEDQEQEEEEHIVVAENEGEEILIL